MTTAKQLKDLIAACELLLATVDTTDDTSLVMEAAGAVAAAAVPFEAEVSA